MFQLFLLPRKRNICAATAKTSMIMMVTAPILSVMRTEVISKTAVGALG